MNTNAINKEVNMKRNNKRLKPWGERIHVKICTKKIKSDRCRGESRTTFNVFCKGDLCKKKNKCDRNTVPARGDECKTCFNAPFEELRLTKTINIRIPFEQSMTTRVLF